MSILYAHVLPISSSPTQVVGYGKGPLASTSLRNQWRIFGDAATVAKPFSSWPGRAWPCSKTWLWKAESLN